MTRKEAREAYEAAFDKRKSAQEQWTTLKAIAVKAEQEYWTAQQAETLAFEKYQKALEGE